MSLWIRNCLGLVCGRRDVGKYGKAWKNHESRNERRVVACRIASIRMVGLVYVQKW